MKQVIITLFVFFFYYQSSFAEGSEMLKNTILHVKLVDKDLKLGVNPVINIQISAYPFGGVEFLKSKEIPYRQAIAGEWNTFNVSSPADVFYMHISYTGIKAPTGACYKLDNIYIIKAGSELTICLDRMDIKFSGEGSIIPNIQSQIIKHSYKNSASDRKLLNGEYLRYFQKLDESLDSALNIQLSIIESNKAILDDYTVKVLKANCYGTRYFAQLKEYDVMLSQNEMFFKTFKKYYHEKINAHTIPKFTNEIIDASPIFTNYLMEELNVLERIGHDDYGPMLPDSCIRNILQKINTNYSGTLRDKLLTIFALRTNKNENALPYFDGLLKGVKTKRYYDLLVHRIKVKENNIPFKNFILEDETGKLYTLDSFKNKVVVLDFWFTGCENCRILNKAMKPIVKHFGGNPKIQFVNISIDRNKEQWINSVKMGNYTHHGGVNLYTNGEGDDNELIRYYNITGYPTVFVIKDGLMFSSLPPRPSLEIPPNQDFSENGARLIQLLEKAMKL